MPLPLIPVFIGLASLAGYGTKKGIGGISKMKQAKKIARSAAEKHESAVEQLKKKKGDVNVEANKYLQTLVSIKDSTFKNTITILEKIGGKHGDKIYEALSDIGFSAPEIQEYKQSLLYVESLFKSGSMALVAGVSAGKAATLGVVLFGTAGTNAAISGLSGAALNNAVLAWLGGGTIASGGGGMALGTVMLGGIAVAPAVLVTGFVLSSKGEKALTKAKEYESEIIISVNKMYSLRSFFGRVIIQIRERDKLMKDLDDRAKGFILKIDADNFDKDNDEDIKMLQGLLQLVKAESEIMKAPILNNDCSALDETGLEIVSKYRQLN